LAVAVIINPVASGCGARAARQRAGLVSAVLAAAGEQGDVWITERRGHARELAARAVAAGARLVVAWGGDGTVNEVASALVSGPAALGLIPGGSGNGLARELGIDRRPAPALRAALRGRCRRIDAGELGGRLFFNVAGIGFDAHVAALFDRQPRGRRGFSTYLRISARELMTYRCGSYQIHGDANVPSRPALLVSIANSAQFGNGAAIAPGARIDDGRLDLVVYEEVSRLRTVCSIPRLFTGQARRIPGLSIRPIERAVVESDLPMAFHVDGEPSAGGRRLEVRVLPTALSVSC
jgi:YegS/Rv2252/BmrU family lipid kinase